MEQLPSDNPGAVSAAAHTHRELRAISVSVLTESGWRCFGEVSLPSFEALWQSPTASAVRKLRTSCPATSSHVFSEFLESVGSESEQASEIIGVHESVRRRDQEKFDLQVAQEELGKALMHNFELAERPLSEALASGSRFQRLIVLGAMVHAEKTTTNLSQQCLPLLQDPSTRDLVLELLKLATPQVGSIAREVAEHLGIALGTHPAVRGPHFDSMAEALRVYCLQMNSFSLVLKGFHSAEECTRAAAVEICTRRGAPFEDSLHDIVQALRDPSRIVVREVFYALGVLGSRALPYAQEIHNVALEEDDFAGALGLELLCSLVPGDSEALELVIDRLQPFLMPLTSDEIIALESEEGLETCLMVAPLASALVQMLPSHGERVGQLLDLLAESDSTEVRRQVAGALRASRQFKPIEDVLEQFAFDVPPVAARAFSVAGQYGPEADDWFIRIERRLRGMLREASDCQREQLLECNDLLRQCIRARERERPGPSEERPA